MLIIHCVTLTTRSCESASELDPLPLVTDIYKSRERTKNNNIVLSLFNEAQG